MPKQAAGWPDKCIRRREEVEREDFGPGAKEPRGRKRAGFRPRLGVNLDLSLDSNLGLNPGLAVREGPDGMRFSRLDTPVVC